MQGLKNFWCYYGGKWRAAKYYPIPQEKTIIEPFCGAAGYSLHSYKHKIILYDLNPKVVGLWKYLIKKLPIDVSHVDDLKICQEAKWLIGWWFNKGTVAPYKTPGAWMRSDKSKSTSWWGDNIRSRIASQVGMIKHWKCELLGYEELSNRKATWFIDPPYEGSCGKHYQYNNIDYTHLASWCKERKGQVIVCEREGATWLPFKFLHTIQTSRGKYGKNTSNEAIWTNLKKSVK